MQKAKSGWILFLDMDETMPAALKKEIKNLDPSDYKGFYVKRCNYFLGRYVGTDIILRLAKKGAGEWKRAVHETWEVEGKLGELKNPIIHNTAGSVAAMVDKINFYSSLHAKANMREGKRSGIIKIMFFPKLKFIQSVFMGRGFVFSLLQAFHSFLAWSKLYFLHS